MIHVYKNFNLLAPNFFLYNILVIKNLNHDTFHYPNYWIQVSTREQKNLWKPHYFTNRFSMIQSRKKVQK